MRGQDIQAKGAPSELMKTFDAAMEAEAKGISKALLPSVLGLFNLQMSFLPLRGLM
jgi:hypothetical protein